MGGIRLPFMLYYFLVTYYFSEIPTIQKGTYMLESKIDQLSEMSYNGVKLDADRYIIRIKSTVSQMTIVLEDMQPRPQSRSKYLRITGEPRTHIRNVILPPMSKTVRKFLRAGTIAEKGNKMLFEFGIAFVDFRADQIAEIEDWMSKLHKSVGKTPLYTSHKVTRRHVSTTLSFAYEY
jgi:hypothetical protein